MGGINNVLEILSDATLRNGMPLSELLTRHTDSIFAIYFDTEKDAVTFYNVQSSGSIQVDTFTHFNVTALEDAFKRWKSDPLVLCDNVLLNPKQIEKITPVGTLEEVPWHQSGYSFETDLSFTLRRTNAEVTINKIKNGVARSLHAAGYSTIRCGFRNPYFAVSKAPEGADPILTAPFREGPQRRGAMGIPHSVGKTRPQTLARI
jgi:hypothetical protein